jgi:hypothetical protein
VKAGWPTVTVTVCVLADGSAVEFSVWVTVERPIDVVVTVLVTGGTVEVAVVV